ncbi:S1 family serine peptidase [Photobacterium sp. R1]
MKAPVAICLFYLSCFFMFASLSVHAQDEESGTPNEQAPQATARIIGGILTQPGELPWQAFVRIDFSENGTEAYQCGGVVIDQETVLTAAHCMVNAGRVATPMHVRVWAGITSLEDAGNQNLAPVSAVIVHPSYNSSNFNNDIAILRLAISLPPRAIPIRIATVATQRRADAEFVSTWVVNGVRPANLLVSGWGSDFPKSEKGVMSLNQTLLSGVPDRSCDALWGSTVYPQVYSLFVCAGPPSPELYRDSCFGDSGGPLVWQDPQASSDSDFGLRLVGLVSFGEGCAGNLPGVYTQVSTYLDWIGSVLGSRFNPAPASVFAVNPFLQDYSKAGLEDFGTRTNSSSDSGGSLSWLTLFALLWLAIRRFRV